MPVPVPVPLVADARRPVVCVLGPCVVQATDGSVATDLSQLQRRLLERLAMADRSVVAVDVLADAVWTGHPPRTARPALQNQVARLRDKLGDEVIVTVGSGYRLGVDTDLQLVRDDVATAESAAGTDGHLTAFEVADSGLARWRGSPLEALDGWTDAVPARRWIGELRRSLEDLRLAAAIELERVAWAVPEAHRLVAADRSDERRWVLLVRSLDRAGRRGEALAAVEQARRHLAEHLGLEPGDELRRVGERLLSPVGERSAPVSPRVLARTALVDSIVSELGAGLSIVLVGEPGIGKSRLLDAVARRERRGGAVVASATCPEYPAGAMATLSELAAGLGQELQPSLPPVVAFRTAAESARAGGARVVLVVDDVDRAGPSTLAAFDAVAQAGVATVLASRTADGGGPEVALPWRLVTVPPLSEEESSDLVAMALGQPLAADDPARRWLFSMAGGNPAMLECLLDDPAAWRLDGPTGGDRSPTVAARDYVRRQVRTVTGAARIAVDAAAVLGSPCSTSLLAGLSSSEGIAGALAAGVLVEAGSSGAAQVAFRHGAMERTVLDDLPPGRRSDLHYHAAALLRAAGAASAAVAGHAVAAADLAPLEAAESAIDAAREAGMRGAHPDAVAWCEQAIVHAAAAGDAGVRTRVEATIVLADSLRLIGSRDHGDRLLDAADAAFALGDPTLIGEATFALLQLGATLDSGDIHDRAIVYARRSRPLVHDRRLAARIAGAASLAHSMTGDATLCRELFLEADALADDERTRRDVLPFAFLALGHPDDAVRRAELADELVALARAADDPVALFEGLQLRFSVAIQRCAGGSLRTTFAEMESLIERIGDVGRRWALEYHRAALAHIEGDLELSERAAEAGLAIFADVSPTRAFAAYGAQLLPLRIAAGRVGELADTLRGLVAETPAVPAWNAALALSLVDTSPAESAHFSRIVLEHDVADFTWLAGLVIGGRAAAAVGDAPTIEAYRDRLGPYAGSGCWQGTCSYGPVDTVLAMLAIAAGDMSAATTALADARRLATSLGSPTFLAELDTLDPP